MDKELVRAPQCSIPIVLEAKARKLLCIALGEEGEDMANTHNIGCVMVPEHVKLPEGTKALILDKMTICEYRNGEWEREE